MGSDSDAISDETLVLRVANADRTAFGMLVDRHALRYRALAFRYLGDIALAEDLVQEAFVKLWTHARKFDADKARFTTWFHRVVVNRCLDEKRRKKPEALPEEYDQPDDSPSVEHDMIQADGNASVARALETLSGRQRMAITLSYFDGLSNAEAADVMKLNLKAYESLLVRARGKLREILIAEKQQLFEALG
ncbi:sigma-70 family RNA polymerase sigma factor [Kordiimonas sp.]|uniref:sigma-70 family RNA polymerase sigma factor n=1 Tax=Kordiimonas sp. TaxID=1970157 RepID=UPI003A9140AE